MQYLFMVLVNVPFYNLYCDLLHSAVSWYFIDWVEMTPTPTVLAQGNERASVAAVVVNKVN